MPIIPKLKHVVIKAFGNAIINAQFKTPNNRTILKITEQGTEYLPNFSPEKSIISTFSESIISNLK